MLIGPIRQMLWEFAYISFFDVNPKSLTWLVIGIGRNSTTRGVLLIPIQRVEAHGSGLPPRCHIVLIFFNFRLNDFFEIKLCD